MNFDSVRLKEMMTVRSLTLAVAESLTTGRIQAAIGAPSGASKYFLGGVTAYTIPQKVTLLDVDEEHALAVDAVSSRVAEEMARGVAALFKSDFSVATTGYAESPPAGGAPFAYVAIWRRQDGSEGHVVFSGLFEGPGLGRVEMQQQVAEFVLTKLQEHLEHAVG